MTSITSDPLLAIAKGILWFLMGVMLIAAVSCLVAIPAMHIFQNEITIELAKEATPFPKGEFLWACSGILLLSAATVLIVFRLLQLLKRIVDTVGLGDPFVPDNAGRLTHMAWLTLALQLVTVPIGALAVWVGTELAKSGAGHTDIDDLDFGISGNGLLLMLILFILARVFRQGAAMRAELEGTV
jgi:hypothetical protein